MTVHEAVSHACGTPIDPGTPADTLQHIARVHQVHAPDEMTAGEIVMHLYDRLVEATTTSPTFYTDFPIKTSPLARIHRADPRLSERWDPVAFGVEIGTVYSELTDPIDQRARLTQQSLRAAAGDEEAMEFDEDFLHALEVGCRQPADSAWVSIESSCVDRRTYPISFELPVRSPAHP